ncbi:MAG TPA: hypothetical protein PLN69_12360 [bacterium]|nr:hypothetical protein [bacterium]
MIPKGIKVTYYMLWFFLGHEVLSLARYSGVTDYVILENAGCGCLFFAFVIVSILLNAVALKYIKEPAGIGLITSLIYLAVALAGNLLVFFFILGDVELAKEAYVESRQSRGLPVRDDAISFMFSSSGIYMSMAILMFIRFIPALLIVWNKEYFLKTRETELRSGGLR